MTALLGLCRHRYGSMSTCGLPVVATRYGPGHASRVKAAHYPVVRSDVSLAGEVDPLSLVSDGGRSEPFPEGGSGR